MISDYHFEENEALKQIFKPDVKLLNSKLWKNSLNINLTSSSIETLFIILNLMNNKVENSKQFRIVN